MAKVAVTAGLVALLLSGTVHAKEPDATREPRDVILASETHGMPPGFHQETRPRYGLVIGGAVTAGVGLTFSALALQNDDSEVLIVPGVICLGVGLPLLTIGFLAPRDVYVRDSPTSISLRASARHGSLGAGLDVAF